MFVDKGLEQQRRARGKVIWVFTAASNVKDVRLGTFSV